MWNLLTRITVAVAVLGIAGLQAEVVLRGLNAIKNNMWVGSAGPLETGEVAGPRPWPGRPPPLDPPLYAGAVFSIDHLILGISPFVSFINQT